MTDAISERFERVIEGGTGIAGEAVNSALQNGVIRVKGIFDGFDEWPYA